MSGLQRVLFSVAIGATLGPAACVPTEVQYSAEVSGPRLAMVSPGIWIVEDQPYAVYYADGFYWRYANGFWYRSGYYDDGFVQVNVDIVPRVVIGGYRPHHVHYRPARHVRVQPIDHRHRSRPHRR
jgi:hypothetical protein